MNPPKSTAPISIRRSNPPKQFSLMRLLRTLLVLGRASNLPTVWSNCLAGWCLAGRGNLEHLPLLLAGAPLLYLGGMFLNDAFDADFDSEHRRERPIPSGAITLKSVWRIGLALLAAGAPRPFALRTPPGLLRILLVVFILSSHAVPKTITLSPAVVAPPPLLLFSPPAPPPPGGRH